MGEALALNAPKTPAMPEGRIALNNGPECEGHFRTEWRHDDGAAEATNFEQHAVAV